MTDIDDKIQRILTDAVIAAGAQFATIDRVALANQAKVLDAFRRNNVSERHLKGSTGYGYGDIGRDTLCAVYADVFHAEAAIVSPLITGGTHALAIGLFGLLRPGDTLLSVTGKPYDTLDSIINGEEAGGMREYGIAYRQVDLIGDAFDFDAIRRALAERPKVVFITRSRGYSDRNALSVQAIGNSAQGNSLTGRIYWGRNTVYYLDAATGSWMPFQTASGEDVFVYGGSINKNSTSVDFTNVIAKASDYP